MQRTTGNFKGHDGAEMFFRGWISKPSKGTIIVTHGMGEHSGSYERLAEGIRPSGYDMLVWDLRGHGKSAGKRGVIRKFSDFSDDLAAFVRHVGNPVLFLSHSMGGLITVRALIDHGTFGAKALGLSSPLLGIGVEIPAIKKAAAKVLAKYAPDFTMPAKIPATDLTHDPKIPEEYANDSLRHDRSSSLFYFEMLASMEYVLANAHKVTLPVLQQMSGIDRIVNAAKGRELFEKFGSKQKKLIVYDELKHEIFNEVERKRVFADLNPWLNQWSQSASSSSSVTP